MKLNLKLVALAGALIGLALPALAQDVALVIGNRSYEHQSGVRDAYLANEAVRPLEDAGFRVLLGQDAKANDQFDLASEFYDALDGADRVVILLAGHIVSDARDSWLLGTNARKQNMFTIGRAGLSVGAILEVAGQKPGGAIVMIANGRVPTVGYGLNAGPGELDIPQGVTVIKGPIAGLLSLLEQDLLEPGNSVGAAMERAPRGVTAEGFLPASIPFLPSVALLPAQDDEASYWEAVRSVGTIEALLTYIERHPNGQHLFEANQMIRALRASPERQAQEAENRLNLNREQRRQIQRNLSILGFNPRGIDGVFGPGSRAAIGAWQQSRQLDGYGYLTGNQIVALQAAADTRSHDLEEEARLQQQEQDQQDASYWRQTGRGTTEAGLRAYLRRYPDGLYSEIAQTRIDEFENDDRNRAAKAERDYWDAVQSNGSAKAYRQYLEKYPNGVFANTAEERLVYLEGSAQDEELIREAKAEEARVAGNGIARLLVEQKLQRLGLKPGRVDGTFDEDTRRALRKFQRARDIPVTGYVTQQTIVRLLAAR